MVVVRIKNDGKNQVPTKINGDDIKIISSLNLCKIINDDEYDKVEKKIEFITYNDNSNSNNNNNNNNNNINESVFTEFNQFNQCRSKYIISARNNEFDKYRRADKGGTGYNTTQYEGISNNITNESNTEYTGYTRELSSKNRNRNGEQKYHSNRKRNSPNNSYKFRGSYDRTNKRGSGESRKYTETNNRNCYRKYIDGNNNFER